MAVIDKNSLEIFKSNVYIPTEMGLVSNNAYLSIVLTNKCQRKCFYCINSETDKSKELPLELAKENIKKLNEKLGFKVKEAIILGGEPLLYPHDGILDLIRFLRSEGIIPRLTTNGLNLVRNSNITVEDRIKQLVDAGLYGINLSYHNLDHFVKQEELNRIYRNCWKNRIKLRINTNIWRGNLDNLDDILFFLRTLNSFGCFDEIRISNLIQKDSFSVNSTKNGDNKILSTEEYNNLFQEIVDYHSGNYAIFENKETLGFVRYVIIPTPCPIILNWNTFSTVSEQVCECLDNKINTFKCLVDGSISLSWNQNNVIEL